MGLGGLEGYLEKEGALAHLPWEDNLVEAVELPLQGEVVLRLPRKKLRHRLGFVKKHLYYIWVFSKAQAQAQDKIDVVFTIEPLTVGIDDDFYVTPSTSTEDILAQLQPRLRDRKYLDRRTCPELRLTVDVYTRDAIKRDRRSTLAPPHIRDYGKK